MNKTVPATITESITETISETMIETRDARWDEATRHLIAADARLGRIIESVGPCLLAPKGIAKPFEALCETIVYQQLTGRAAATIFGRLCKLFRGKLTPKAILRAGEEKLRSVGLSGPKLRSLEDLARRVDSRELVLDLLEQVPDAELSERLVAVKGIGPWSVQMVLMFRLGRPDVWPVTDLGIRKGAQKVWGYRELPDAKQLERVGRPLAPYRSVAAWYLWRCLEIPDLPGFPGNPVTGA